MMTLILNVCLLVSSMLTCLTISQVGAFTVPIHGVGRTIRRDLVRETQTVAPASEIHRQNVPAHRVLSTSRHAAASAVAAALPGWPVISAACILPTCLGFYKREYGVSYAYGGAVSLMAFLVYRSLSASNSSIAAWHAMALMFYGIRLNSFLLYRELSVPSMRKFRDRVEDKAVSNEENRFSRTPVILSCSFLYYCLSAPLLVTSHLGKSAVSGTNIIIRLVLNLLVATVWGGFLVAAVGDITKTLVKKQKNNVDHLVTEGIFKYLRHPNYTGETVAWTASALLALVSAGLCEGVFRKPVLAVYSILSLVGAAGIDFVLLAATRQLEKKQKKKYSEFRRYEGWMKNSWVGFQLAPKDEKDHVEPHIEMSLEQEERGSGI